MFFFATVTFVAFLATTASLQISLTRTVLRSNCRNGHLIRIHYRVSPPLSSTYLDELYDETDFDSETSKSPLDQFLTALEESIKDETILKLTLLENESSKTSEIDEAEDSSAGIIGSDFQRVKEWAAVSGRLIKTKSESKLQLICYKDKSMKSSDLTKNYSSCEEAVSVVSAYIKGAFKKGTLSTKDNDFEIKMKRGQGKFRATSKVSCHVNILFCPSYCSCD
jgi:hypothetical protein